MLNYIPFILFFLLSCAKESPTPHTDSGFPVHFIFVNKDTSLQAVNLESSYYDVIKDSSYIYTKVYCKDQSLSGCGGQTMPDSIVHKTYTGHIGCKKAFQIKLVWKGVNTPSRVYRSNIYSQGDTINNAKEGIEIFHWPTDSAKYVWLK